MAVLELNPSVFLLVLAVVLLIGFLGRWIFLKTRVPDTLLLMGLGFVIGQTFAIETAPFLAVMPYVGVLALIAILFDGGLDLKIKDLVTGLPRASTLSFAGFGFSVLLVTLYGHLAYDLDWLKAALLGAIVGGTSSVIVMPMLPGLKLGKKSETMLGLESALTDVLCVVGALALATTIAQGGGSAQGFAATFAASFAVALLIGFGIGVIWLYLLERIRMTGNEYIWTMAVLFFMYGMVDVFGGSGPIAVLTFGIVLGNSAKITRMFGMPMRRISHQVDRFQDEIVFFVRSFFFVFLGVLFEPRFLSFDGGITSPFVKALGIVAMLLVARIAAVALATIGDPKLIEHRARFVLLMPRGLAAAVLASIPAAAPYNIEGVGAFVSYAFAVLLFSNVLATFAGLIGSERAAFRPTRIWGRRGEEREETPTPAVAPAARR